MTFRNFTKGKPFYGSVYASEDIPGIAKRGELLESNYDKLTVTGCLIIPKKGVYDIYVK